MMFEIQKLIEKEGKAWWERRKGLVRKKKGSWWERKKTLVMFYNSWQKLNCLTCSTNGKHYMGLYWCIEENKYYNCNIDPDISLIIWDIYHMFVVNLVKRITTVLIIWFPIDVKFVKYFMQSVLHNLETCYNNLEDVISYSFISLNFVCN